MFTAFIAIFLCVLFFIFKFIHQQINTGFIFYALYLLFAVAFVAVLVSSIITAIKSVIHRLSFCGKVKKLAKKKGFEYQTKNNAFISFFKSYRGEDIVLKKDDKVICLKFFPKPITKWSVHIIDGNKAELTKKMALLGTHVSSGTGVMYSGSRGVPVTGNLFSLKIKINLSFNSENTENIIIVPKCYGLTCVEGNSNQIVGSGHIFNKKSKIYFQNDFLNYFDRY